MKDTEKKAFANSLARLARQFPDLSDADAERQLFVFCNTVFSLINGEARNGELSDERIRALVQQYLAVYRSMSVFMERAMPTAAISSAEEEIARMGQLYEEKTCQLKTLQADCAEWNEKIQKTNSAIMEARASYDGKLVAYDEALKERAHWNRIYESYPVDNAEATIEELKREARRIEESYRELNASLETVLAELSTDLDTLKAAPSLTEENMEKMRSVKALADEVTEKVKDYRALYDKYKGWLESLSVPVAQYSFITEKVEEAINLKKVWSAKEVSNSLQSIENVLNNDLEASLTDLEKLVKQSAAASQADYRNVLKKAGKNEN